VFLVLAYLLMNVIFHHTVLAFLHDINEQEAADIVRLTELLAQRGHTLSMPISKPSGRSEEAEAEP